MSNQLPWNIAVLGPGGIGGLLAALFARAGHRVVCLAGEETAAALRSGGISVRSGQFGDFTASVDADTRLRTPVDLCVVAVKATALPQALDRVPAEVLGEGLLLPLLNGVEHMAVLRSRYSPGQVVAGTIKVESTRTAPGVIEQGSPFAEVELASDTAPAARVAALAEVIAKAGPGVAVGDERTALWTKMAFLAPMALATTRYRAPVGVVRTEHRADLLALLAEAAAVAAAAGAAVDADRVRAVYDSFPETTKSSMLRDAEAGRPLELDAIGGALLRGAQRGGVEVPTAARLVSELRALDASGE
ncbi:ketopantoate reductase family protein [Streptomyces polyrhachis]|uniref:2-dehydropantoate 2-reductase n=1 Tax=Streptomyces polyrhachis TaxID=1282885 RepID=A0ABW2GCF5_9ACTN